MLPSLLCAALALAAPAEKPPVHMRMDIFPESPMLGDIVIVKITATNYGKKAVSVPPWYDRLLNSLRFETVRVESPYRYLWTNPRQALVVAYAPLVPLAPGERRVVTFDALELPPIRDIRHEFWTDLTREEDEEGAIWLRARLGYPDYRLLNASAELRAIRPRPPQEVAALLAAYADESPQGFPGWPTRNLFGLNFPAHLATPEKLAELEAKLSDGMLRDTLRAARLFQVVQIVAADKDHPRGDAERRVAAKELFALLDESAELERQWLAYNIFKGLYYGDEPDEIEREFLEGVARRLPNALVDKIVGHAPEKTRHWPFLKQEQKAEAAGAPDK